MTLYVTVGSYSDIFKDNTTRSFIRYIYHSIIQFEDLHFWIISKYLSVFAALETNRKQQNETDSIYTKLRIDQTTLERQNLRITGLKF